MIGVCTWAGGGNANPAVHLAARLVRRGHDVQVIGWPEQRGFAERCGVPFSAYPSMSPWPAGLPLESDWDALTARLHGPDTAADIVTVARGCELLIVDCMMWAGYLAAAELGAETITLLHTLYQRFWRPVADQILPGDAATVLDASSAVLVTTPAALDLPGDVPANTHYVGAITASDVPRLGDIGLDALRARGAPWVLVSLSTTMQGQDRLLPAILAAVAELPVRVLVTLGGVDVDGLDAPANVLVRDFVPHEAVLPHVGAVITHGGMSTVATALAFGVPLVCIPQGREQPANAERVAAVGAGIALEQAAAPREIALALSAVLGDAAFGAAAAQFRDAAPGERAADLVDQAVRRRNVAAASTSASAALPATTNRSRA